MYPDWLIGDTEFPPDNLEGHLRAAQALIPDKLLADSGMVNDLAQCAELGYFHFWMNTLQDVGWYAQEKGRDDELPAEFWARVAAAAHAMEYPEFVPYLLGKARGLPRQDVPDLAAAFATLPTALGADWRREHEGLARLCDQAASHLRAADPDAGPLLDAADVPALSARLASSGALERAGDAIGELIGEAFDELFAVVADPSFPADRIDHAWAVIATNRFQVQVSAGLFPATYATVWWRA